MSPSLLPAFNRSVKILLAAMLTLSILLSACSAQAAPTPEPTSAPTAVKPVFGKLPGSATKAPAPTEAVPPTAAASTVSFSKDILPILESRCIKCHGGEKISKGLNMTTYNKLMTGSENGVVVVPSDVDNSLVIKLIRANKMPKQGPKLLPDQVQLLIDWVKAGALNN